MKVRPILFSAPMVRALLDGSKTQTRRIVKRLEVRAGMPEPEWESLLKCCPYGEPEDQIWVRETHLPTARGVIYRADFSEFEAVGTGAMYGGWKPSIFCRREHSRITLGISGVRVERLKDISDADCIAEGIESEPGTAHWKNYETGPGWRYWESPKQSYRTLWESINGPGSWDLNPWVWVIEFKKAPV